MAMKNTFVFTFLLCACFCKDMMGSLLTLTLDTTDDGYI